MKWLKVGVIIGIIVGLFIDLIGFISYKGNNFLDEIISGALILFISIILFSIIGFLISFLPDKFFKFFRVPPVYLIKTGFIFVGIWIFLFVLYAIGFFFKPWFGGPSANQYFHDSIYVFTYMLFVSFLIGAFIGWIYGKIKLNKQKEVK